MGGGSCLEMTVKSTVLKVGFISEENTQVDGYKAGLKTFFLNTHRSEGAVYHNCLYLQASLLGSINPLRYSLTPPKTVGMETDKNEERIQPLLSTAHAVNRY